MNVILKYYGCGLCIPPHLKGTTVLDLGCGAGRDVYAIAQLTGESGKVIGVDMTDEQLETAREFEEYHRKKFGFQQSNDAVFYRTYPILYLKFETMVIFRSEN
mgnify:CR=1 FL=1